MQHPLLEKTYDRLVSLLRFRKYRGPAARLRCLAYAKPDVLIVCTGCFSSEADGEDVI